MKISNSGERVIKNAIKFNPWDGSTLDVLHNYGLSATDRASVAAFMEKHPYKGPSTVKQILDDPQFLEKVKGSPNRQEILNQLRTQRSTTAMTQTEVDNADINQVIENNNSEHEARNIETEAHKTQVDTSGSKAQLSFKDEVKLWFRKVWHGGVSGDRRKAVSTLFKEAPKLAETLNKQGLTEKILDMLAAKVDDKKGTREFLDMLTRKVDPVIEFQQEADPVEDPGTKKAVKKLKEEEIKTILVDEDHLQRFLKDHPEVNEKTVRDMATAAKTNIEMANPDEIFKIAYKQTWEANKSIVKSEYGQLLDNLKTNGAKGFLVKALDVLKKSKIGDFLAYLDASHKTTTDGELKQIMEDYGIPAKDRKPNKITEFKRAFNADKTGLFSRTDQHTLDEKNKNLIKTKLGLDDDNAARFLEGLKDAKSLTPEKITKLGKKFKVNLNPQAYDFTGERWAPLDRFATQGEKIAMSWKSSWEGSSMDDIKSGWKGFKGKLQKGNRLATSFQTITSLVGAGGMGMSFYTCAYKQLGELPQKEQNLTDLINNGTIMMDEMETNLNATEADIKISKKLEIEAHCGLSRKFVAFILEMTGNMDKPVRPCSSLTVNATDLVGRRLTYTAIASCYGEEFKDDNPYRGEECVDQLPNLDTDNLRHQEFLRDKLGNMRTFLQKNKDIIAEELDKLVLRYNVEVLVNEDFSFDRIVRTLKSFGFTEGADFTKFSILKLIAQHRVSEAMYHGYPLKCFREEKIRNQGDLQRWQDTFLALDEDKLTDFREAVEDQETLDYMKRKAKRGRYHFTGAGLPDEELEGKILTEIATRILITESEYEDEDGQRYPLEALRTQDIC